MSEPVSFTKLTPQMITEFLLAKFKKNLERSGRMLTTRAEAEQFKADAVKRVRYYRKLRRELKNADAIRRNEILQIFLKDS